MLKSHIYLFFASSFLINVLFLIIPIHSFIIFNYFHVCFFFTACLPRISRAIRFRDISLDNHHTNTLFGYFTVAKLIVGRKSKSSFIFYIKFLI